LLEGRSRQTRNECKEKTGFLGQKGRKRLNKQRRKGGKRKLPDHRPALLKCWGTPTSKGEKNLKAGCEGGSRRGDVPVGWGEQEKKDFNQQHLGVSAPVHSKGL